MLSSFDLILKVLIVQIVPRIYALSDTMMLHGTYNIPDQLI